MYQKHKYSAVSALLRIIRTVGINTKTFSNTKRVSRSSTGCAPSGRYMFKADNHSKQIATGFNASQLLVEFIMGTQFCYRIWVFSFVSINDGSPHFW
jgi:hypothetical protein